MPAYNERVFTFARRPFSGNNCYN